MTNGRRSRIRVALASLALVTVITPIMATRADAATGRGVQASGYLKTLRAGPATGRSTTVGTAPSARAARSANIQVTYTGFTTAAKAAFQAAVNIWETKITSSVTIHVQADYTNLGNTGILGSAGPTTIHRDFNHAAPGQWYVAATANKIAGSDLNGSQAEISASFNNQFPNWYFGTSGPTPANKYDFESVVLHELGHGLGFLVSFQQSGSSITHGISGFPLFEDQFATDNQGRKANRFPSGSDDFENAVTGNNLFWNGNKGKQANGGNRPRLFAPNPFQPGSSASHLDENTYPAGNANSLMTPFLGQGERIVNPGTIAIGILNDSGWATASK